jgi:hypothetical protein
MSRHYSKDESRAFAGKYRLRSCTAQSACAIAVAQLALTLAAAAPAPHATLRPGLGPSLLKSEPEQGSETVRLTGPAAPEISRPALELRTSGPTRVPEPRSAHLRSPIPPFAESRTAERAPCSSRSPSPNPARVHHPSSGLIGCTPTAALQLQPRAARRIFALSCLPSPSPESTLLSRRYQDAGD